MDKIKPIKRSPQLVPLSKEHHDALLFVWKIRQGLKLGASLEKMRNYTMWYWKEHTRPHFFQEEKILLPHIPAGHPLAIQLLNEHAQVRELVLSLDKDPDPETFTQLANLAERHIRWEERKFFGYLEEHLSPDELNAVKSSLDDHPLHCGDWKDEFWVKR